jgi:inosine-uridine nucleoside N-ribohydrolase
MGQWISKTGAGLLGILVTSMGQCISKTGATSIQEVPDECLIVDTDMGIDDIAAILLLVAHGASIKMITTTHGTCETTPARYSLGTTLARRLLASLMLQDVLVVAGGSCPEALDEAPDWLTRLRAKLLEAGDVLDLLDDPQGAAAPGPTSSLEDGEAAAKAILSMAGKFPGRAVVLALGPLTNIATAARLKPELFSKHVKKVIIASDSLKSMPFNVMMDPAAVQTVLDTGTSVVFVGTKCRPAFGHVQGKQWVESLLSSGKQIDEDGAATGDTSTRNLAAVMLRAAARWHPLALCQDPVTAAYLLRHEAYQCQPKRICVKDGGLSEIGPSHELPALSSTLEARKLDFETYEQLMLSAMHLSG